MITERGDEVELFLHERREQMVRRIVLHELSHEIGGDDPLVCGAFQSRNVEAERLRAIDDRGNGDLDLVFFFQRVAYRGVVVPSDRNVFVFDEFLFLFQLFFDVRLGLFRYSSPPLSFDTCDCERLFVRAKTSNEIKEPTRPHAELRLRVRCRSFFGIVLSENSNDLRLREAL